MAGRAARASGTTMAKLQAGIDAWLDEDDQLLADARAATNNETPSITGYVTRAGLADEATEMGALIKEAERALDKATRALKTIRAKAWIHSEEGEARSED
jgi:hypothetical protein